MNFAFSDEQNAFRAALREIFLKEADVLSRLEAMGALELDGVEAAIVFEESGRAAVRLPAVSDAFSAAATLIGVGSRATEMGAEYALQRQQFGKVIGSFQAVKHRLADALLQVTFARPVVYAAAVTGVERDVSMAKAFASDAATFACKAALQVHGAIGYTEEHELHRWLRLGFMLANGFGTAAWHREQIAQAIL